MSDIQKQNIIEIARKMYVTQGIKAVRMDDIAHKAGISKRTLYELFGDKEELMLRAMQHHFGMLHAENVKIGLDSPNILIAIVRIMANIVKNSDTNWKLHNALDRFFPKISKRLLEVDSEEHRIKFRQALNEGVDQGLLQPRANLDLAIVMLQYLAKSIAAGYEDLVLPDGVTPQDAFMEVTVNVIRGISTPRGIEIIDTFCAEEELNRVKRY